MIAQIIRWIAAFPSMLVLVLYTIILALLGASIERLWPWENPILNAILSELERNTNLGSAINAWILGED